MIPALTLLFLVICLLRLYVRGHQWSLPPAGLLALLCLCASVNTVEAGCFGNSATVIVNAPQVVPFAPFFQQTTFASSSGVQTLLTPTNAFFAPPAIVIRESVFERRHPRPTIIIR